MNLDKQISIERKVYLDSLEFRRQYEEALIKDGHDAEEIAEQMMIYEESGFFDRKARICNYDFVDKTRKFSPNQDTKDSCRLYGANLRSLFRRLYEHLQKAWNSLYKQLAG